MTWLSVKSSALAFANAACFSSGSILKLTRSSRAMPSHLIYSVLTLYPRFSFLSRALVWNSPKSQSQPPAPGAPWRSHAVSPQQPASMAQETLDAPA